MGDYDISAVMSFNEFIKYYKKVISGKIRLFELMKPLGINKRKEIGNS